MPLDIAQVEPGDLIFTYTGADLSIAGTPTGHVMMAGERDKLDVVTQIHQVRRSMQNDFPGTARERLIPNSTKKAGESASRKRVLRCNVEELRGRAAKLALRIQRWFQLDFAEDRIAAATIFETKRDAGTVLTDLRKHFDATGKFRAIKYAARRNSFLCYPDEKGRHGKGMFCSMFVVLCYQIAGLEDYVKAAPHTDTLLRISDKKMRPKDFKQIEKDVVKGKPGSCDRTDFNDYHAYTEKLREDDPYQLGSLADNEPGKRRSKFEYRPSIDYWDFSKCPSIATANWAGIVTAGMMVDSKIVMPRGLYDSLVSDGAGWTDMGDLTGKQDFEDPAFITQRAKELAAESDLRRQSWVKGKVV